MFAALEIYGHRKKENFGLANTSLYSTLDWSQSTKLVWVKLFTLGTAIKNSYEMQMFLMGGNGASHGRYESVA